MPKKPEGGGGLFKFGRVHIQLGRGEELSVNFYVGLRRGTDSFYRNQAKDKGRGRGVPKY